MVEKKYRQEIIFISTTLIIFLIDRIIKLLIQSKLLPDQPITIIPNFFHLTYITNTGAAFSLFSGYNHFLFIIGLLMIIIVSVYFFKTEEKQTLPSLMLGLIVGGALGNLFDRLFFGSVIDFLDFRIWPAFNFADTAITIGIIFLVVYFIKNK